MGIAVTIGVMFLLFGFIGYMQDEGPVTWLDRLHPFAYILLGGIVLINCLVHFLIKALS